MTHYNNAIAAYLNARDCRKQGRNYEADRYDEMARTFCRWHVKEGGGTYSTLATTNIARKILKDKACLDVYLDMVAEAVGYYKKAS